MSWDLSEDRIRRIAEENGLKVTKATADRAGFYINNRKIELEDLFSDILGGNDDDKE
ncbi:hypothetical protein [Paraliobacillus ryukyuensis]|uniref:hypothetical protein n=1 Tax=Paraliobacillus ryukyuensis TaxID=200904 RepID=UPI0015C4B602|nr:hypothetical protein [Paraliobacillus ryukyuensis]